MTPRSRLGTRVTRLEADGPVAKVEDRGHGRMSSPVAATVTAVALVVVFVGWADRGEREVATQASGSRMPARIAAVKTDGRVVLLSSRNGRELRTLATGGDSKTTVTVMPNLGRVLFDRPRSSKRGCGPREIVSVPLAGGRVGRVTPVAGSSAQPSVSPDGKKLAFVNYQGPAGCTQPQSLAIKDVNSSGSVQGWSARDGRQCISAPSWAPDSRNIVFGLFTCHEKGIAPHVLDTHAWGQDLTATSSVPWPEAGVRLDGYAGATNAFLATELLEKCPVGSPPCRYAVAVFDPATGQRRRVLFELPNGGFPQRVATERSGNHVLAVETGDRLYTWSDGDMKPRKVAEDVVAAAWVPRR